MQALHAKKLEQALRSRERFPVNLEWMVDVFKYKHISSLTTHLKRHFKMNVHYKRFSQEQNKRVWTYFISVDCFIGICEYVRHAARKKIANLWLRKVGIKGNARRIAREFNYSSEEDDEEQEDEQEDEYYEEEVAQPAEEAEEGNEEYQGEGEEDGDETDERGYFQEEAEEEYEDSSSLQADSEEEDGVSSSAEYDSSSSAFDTPPARHRTAALTISTGGNYAAHAAFNRQFPPQSPYAISHSRSLSFSSDSYSSSPASSAPSSPVMAPRFSPFAQAPANTASPAANGPSFPAQNASFPAQNANFAAAQNPSFPAASPTGTQGFGGSPQPQFPQTPQATQSAAPLTGPSFMQRMSQLNLSSAAPVAPQQQSLPATADTPRGVTPLDKVDWSYLLRPAPAPFGAAVSDLSNRLFTSILYAPQFYQQPPVHNVMLNSNSLCYPFANHNAMHFHHHHGQFVRQDESAFGERLPDLPFDTNMFLSIPDESLYSYQHQ